MPEDKANQRYAGIVDWWRFNVGDQKELVYSPTTHSTHILSSGTVRLLRECKEMNTLDAHASRLCQHLNLGADRLPAMRQQLVEFVNAELLVSYESLSEQLAKNAHAEEVPPEIASLAIPTRNRPQVLKRCLDSYAECAKVYGRDRLTVQVMDQSDGVEDRQANRQALEAVKATYGIHGQYWTAVDAEKFARDLCQHSDLAPDVVNFALVNDGNMPQAHGLSRNFLLLATIGDLTVQVDDDTICSVTPCRESSHGLTLTSRYAPQEFWFLSESETASLGEGFSREDFFALHEQLLGRSIASCAERAEGQLNFDQVTSDFFRRLSKPGGRVAATSLGVAGEAGMEGSFYFLTMEGKSRPRLMRSEGDYRFALNYHQVLRSVTTATVSSGSVITGHNQGFDNRHFLPPYFPLWRGEDMAFGELLSLSAQGAFNGYLPWHLLHKPMVPRKYSPDHLRVRASRLSFGAIMEALLQSFKTGRERSPEKCIEAAGKWLSDWGRAPLADFDEMLTLLLMRRVSMQIMRLEGELKQYGRLPAYWAADIEMCLQAMREMVVQKNYIVGRDLADFYGPEEARKVQQLLVRRFGELLQSWSAIREAAGHLRARGLQLVK